ncbi:phosphate/phosphite/phosphonate ABC transporter substrate-binding protein [Methylomonas sp. AM2-LC]|uniref:phosphate/phosphite/phosphonate ABC transporter substrate-binding protein n=1 Tax=Methylomonas sp. AM2-LC TaxID=3153301 RepID=UPI003266818B
MTSVFYRIFSLCFLLLAASPAVAQKPVQQQYSFYVVPQAAPLAIHSAWYPVLEKLSQATGLVFDLHVIATLQSFEVALLGDEPDFAFINPYQFLLTSRQQLYIPMLRDSSQLLTGILVVRKDSPITSIHDLNGQTLAFPSSNAFASSLFVRSDLATQGISIHPSYVNTHTNVYRSVLLGDVVAGGGVNNTFIREPLDVQQQLRILYRTPETIPHPLVANRRIPAAVREKITKAFISLAADPANATLFNAIQIPQPVVANASDYEALKNLHLENFVVKSVE